MRILFATDGGSAADAAARLLERLDDRARVRIDVLSVASFDLALAEAEARGGYSPEAARDRAERIARESVDRLSRAGFGAEPLVAAGHPTLEILRAIEEGGCDLTLVGAGRRTWLGQLLLGSVSTAILQAAPSTVLVVREARQEPERVRVLVGADGSDCSEHAARSLIELADPGTCSVLVVSVAGPTGPGEPVTRRSRRTERARTATGSPRCSRRPGSTSGACLGGPPRPDPAGGGRSRGSRRGRRRLQGRRTGRADTPRLGE